MKEEAIRGISLDESQDKDLPGHETKSRVFVINKGYHDYSSALEFGELVPLSQGRINVTNTDRLEGEMQDKLLQHNYDPERDYILLSGSILQSYVLGGYLAKHYERVKTLYWDTLLDAYRERTFTFNRRTLL